ncbi:MAG: anthranilate synthase component I family protein [Campylobacteraceae bacterium]|jgi:anthranilate synthase component 1|nr:anthranilate synthase component I family protein [Campylobacteraceae bacterium]MBT3882279.1 anthranilate synthase component I family protein [Campylobacteraceae bacterium]MBT4030315.1 anthranilate synthase component I family protein [Campylobacteraceae bacterium]MBT4179167.1 anthranilate synthase component I family protein [Campylobacteraceae bacterium]MBT4572363.1 anthranilate synthase component I family protein [Campylobacteraceae bacterium]
MFYSKSLILDQFTPVSIYQKIQNLFTDEITFLFESVLNGNDGNFSYIIIGDRERVWHKDGKSFHKDENNNIQEIDSNPFNFLKTYYNNIDKKIYKDKAQELGIGLVDGFIGNIGYDMVQEWEPKLKNSMANLKDTIGIADFDLIRPKIILGFSHKTSKLTIVTSLDSMKDQLNIIEDELHKNFEYTPLKKAKLLNEGSFTHSKEKFFDMVAQSKEMIKSGDVFQILMTNRFTQKVEIDNLSFYRGLRSKNPSPYLFLLEYEDFCIAGSSPEVMVRLTDGKILLRPIAGTRKRGKTPKRDQEMADELISDPKERAEHIMLIDLGRNDLGRVSKAGTVKVTDLMRIEKYSHVMHIVTDLEATIDEEKYDMFDLFSATFTAGTMTGAPKIRAMELIAKYEQLKRSFYSGSIAYFGFDGNMDSAITIRTTLIKDNEIIFQAGAGVVADSIPELEYLEVTNKLAANIATLKDLT